MNDNAYEFSKWAGDASAFIDKHPSVFFSAQPPFAGANGELMKALIGLDQDTANIWKEFEGRKHWLQDYLDEIDWVRCD